jgi:hypothetical protein
LGIKNHFLAVGRFGTALLQRALFSAENIGPEQAKNDVGQKKKYD